jgi:hypothetical protein
MKTLFIRGVSTVIAALFVCATLIAADSGAVAQFF